MIILVGMETLLPLGPAEPGIFLQTSKSLFKSTSLLSKCSIKADQQDSWNKKAFSRSCAISNQGPNFSKSSGLGESLNNSSSQSKSVTATSDNWVPSGVKYTMNVQFDGIITPPKFWTYPLDNLPSKDNRAWKTINKSSKEDQHMGLFWIQAPWDMAIQCPCPVNLIRGL